jgi:chromosomal replication initiation ATPase DnaA
VSFALPLRWAPIFTQDHFFISLSNEDAFSWIHFWPWPFSHLWMFGPHGCGKTHLATLWAKKHNAYWIDPHHFPSVLPHAYCIIDWNTADPNRINHADVYAFLLRVQESQARCLWLAHQSAAHWDGPVADVRSRIHAMMSVEITPPDDILLAKVLEKSLLDIGWKIHPRLIAFLVRRMPRSFSSVAELTRMVRHHGDKPGLSVGHLKSILHHIESQQDWTLESEG